jgi:hypothetical protein
VNVYEAIMKTWKKAIIYPLLGISAILVGSAELARTIPIVVEKEFTSKQIYIKHYKKVNPHVDPIIDCGFNFNKAQKKSIEKAKQMYYEGKGKKETALFYNLPYEFKTNSDTLILFGGDTLKNQSTEENYKIGKGASYYFEGYLSPKEILREVKRGKLPYDNESWMGCDAKELAILLKNTKKDLSFIVENPDSIKIDSSKCLYTRFVKEKLP